MITIIMSSCFSSSFCSSSCRCSYSILFDALLVVLLVFAAAAAASVILVVVAGKHSITATDIGHVARQGKTLYYSDTDIG